MKKSLLEEVDMREPGAKAGSFVGTGGSVEEFERAVGEHALLQTEVNRKMALRIVEMREEMRAAKKEMEALRKQVDGLVRGVAQVLELAGLNSWRSAAARDAVKPKGVPRLLNAEKLLKMGSDVRLNIGCGNKPLPDYLNVDERELEGVDLIADARELPFKTDSVSEIFAAHLIEHFTESELRSVVVPGWHRLLQQGGLLVVTTPDAVGMIQAFNCGELSFEDLRTVTYGGQDYAGNFHYTMFSRDSLRTIFREAGFVVQEYAALARRNGLCLEMELRAGKM